MQFFQIILAAFQKMVRKKKDRAEVFNIIDQKAMFGLKTYRVTISFRSIQFDITFGYTDKKFKFH